MSISDPLLDLRTESPYYWLQLEVAAWVERMGASPYIPFFRDITGPKLLIFRERNRSHRCQNGRIENQIGKALQGFA
jgi:hypothetical protein